MDTKSSTQNPNPNPTMVFHFIKALSNIQKTATTTTSFGVRSRRINRAAYASMAVAAGPRRAWSQAVLQRLRRRRIGLHRARVSRSRAPESSLVDRLRRVVPGGKSLDLCCLLEETASYVQCLGDQVALMQSIVDSADSY